MQCTRRQFLGRSAAIPAAAMAPYFITSAQAAPQTKNERPLVAVIGTGVTTEWDNTLRKGRSQGRGSYLGEEASRFADVVACCDVDRQHAETFAARYDGKCRIYSDFRKVLERKDVEAVLIATPDHWHAAIAIAAMRAGKDVYCEKPMTLTIDEGKRICRVVKETGRVVQVGTQRRTEYNGLFLKFATFVRSGRLGRPLTITATTNPGERGGPFPPQTPPAGLDWDFWLGQTPKVPYHPHRCHLNFRWWLEYSGGEVTDWGAHFIDIAQWALGCENTGPVEIEGTGDFPTAPNCYNTAVTFDCTLKFANGSKILFRSVPKEEPKGVLVEGDQGRIFVNQGRLTGKPIEELTKQEQEQLDEASLKLCKGKQPGNHMQNFFECIKDRGETLSDPFSHHRTISSCHLCNIAMRAKRKLIWDPVREDFVGDAEASRMLSRPQREPYTLERMTS